MLLRSFLLTASLVVVIPAAAQYLEPLPGAETYRDRIEVRTDLRFGPDEYQTLDAYLPVPAGAAPAVLCWFGGAFWGADKSQMAALAEFLASRGFVAVAPRYFLGTRDGRRASWPRAIIDAKSAVRYVRAHATELHVNPDRIYALGYSSGAYLAMMTGFTPNLAEFDSGENPTVSSAVAAVVDISGVCDRRRDLGQPLALLGAGYEEKWDLRVAASPVSYVSARTVPVYILHGRSDRVADVSSATELADTLATAQVPHVLRLVGAQHAPVTAPELERIVVWLENLPRRQ